MKSISLLKAHLMPLFPINQARISFVAQFVIALLDAQTCNLNTLALKFKGKAKTQSHYKRIQRFLRQYPLDFGLFTKAIVKFMPAGDKWIIVIDRTNWNFGKKNINLMVLGIAYKGVCILLLRSFLNKQGCSNVWERIQLTNRFLKLISLENIEYMTADREFIGRDWLLYLKVYKISFRIRIRKNMQVRSSRSHQLMDVTRLFCGNSFQKAVALRKKRKVWGLEVFIVGLRIADGYVILITDHAPYSAMEDCSSPRVLFAVHF